ncbi:hypothetical protein HBE96_17535 [Clostridium sp. P21]|uniref:Uncharacterized protein n=1 Tax=Clostridium muellerianum TaxID=2716538 RepID=A0A7Y0HNX0_9CLOT|nr:hypothetical protein [Clostridium muellerianum]NMM64424.1 hypothetical protein [Clostridium muellerianum]
MFKSKNTMITLVTAFIVIVSISFFGYQRFSINNKYENIISEANKAMGSEQYDNAVKLYEEAMNYKKDDNTKKQIDLAIVLKQSKSIYESAMKQMANKKYLEAIDYFNKVSKQDSKRYNESQSKIAECKKSYIDYNLKNANDSLKNSKFSEANNYIDLVLKQDANNADARKLKDDAAQAANIKAKENTSALGDKIMLTEDQAFELVKSKVKINEKQERLFRYSDFKNAPKIADDCPYYLIVKDAITPSGDEDFTEAEYQVDKHSGKIKECIQGQCKEIN